MKKIRMLNRKTAASLAGTGLLILATSATAQLTVTPYNQLGSANTWPFTPSWTVNTNNSLIAGMAPTTALGNFSLEVAGRDVDSLTLNTDLTIGILEPSTSTTANYVTCGNGSGAGSLVVYTLPISPNGYNLTNITVFGGWANNGRDAQGYTLLYSTVENPGNFQFLTTVNYNPSVPGNTASANQVVINDALGGAIATNVAAVEFDFSNPQVENGYCGYAAITVGGTPAASIVEPAISITSSNEDGSNPFTPSWTPETPDLLAGLTPTTANGNFGLEGSGGTPVLTDGLLGASGDVTGFATCGANGGTTLIYTLTNNPVNGTDVTNIITYSGWGDGGRDGQYYIVSYSTVSAPANYTPITTVYYLPSVPGGSPANRVSIAMNDGSALAHGVANIKFDFASPPSAGSFNNGYQGYSEIIVQGHDTTAPPPPPSAYLTQDTLPTHAETVTGDQIVFTAAYSNFPPVTLQWQQITTSPAATNAIASGVVNVSNNGVTTSTLTLNGVTAANSGTYRLVGLNATNGAAAPSYSTPASLAVGSPSILGNAVLQYAGQAGPAGFYPPWTINTNLDLIFQSVEDSSGNPGTSTPGSGNFSLQSGLALDPAILVDGELTNSLDGMVSCGWVNSGAGVSVTYSLPAGPANGYDITNIAVYGGWPDDGRNEQEYQVLYSTMAAPTVFTSLGTFIYNPSFNDGGPSATRTTIVPVSGALAHNVYAVEFNFNEQPKNNWEGYAQITINGTASLGVVPTLSQDITPLTAEDVAGSQIILTASFGNATSVQWMKNGTTPVNTGVVTVNNGGILTSTLTLNNLQLTDTATNGGYSLTGINAAGSTSSRGCSVIVDPTPAPVGNVVTAYAYQSSDAGAPNSFGPTWSTANLANSLIYQQDPPSVGYGTGDFTGGSDKAGGLPVLTDGSYGLFAFDTTHPAFAAGGPNAGQYVIYSLGDNTNGYSVTNIQVAGGWNDNGRNSQFFTVSYSSVATPTAFIPIKAVAISPTFPEESVVRTTITAANGILASNVYAIEVDFTEPPGVPNGYSGYSEISVFGSPSTGVEAAPPPGTVGNPSFELNVATVGGVITAVPSYWTAFNEGGSSDIGSQEAGGTDYTVHNPMAPPADGNQYCYINMFNPPGLIGGIYQDTGALQPYTTYTLTVAIGSRADRINSPGIISLLNGVDDTGTVLATGGGLPATQNTWQDYSVTYTTGASVSGDLTVELSVLGADTIQADFDNVRLTVAPLVPVLAPPQVANGKLILTGSGGVPNGGYTWLSTTNLTPPVVWTTNSTGTLDASGSFSNSIPINTAQQASFFRLLVP
jgi:hypothetical protein